MPIEIVITAICERCGARENLDSKEDASVQAIAGVDKVLCPKCRSNYATLTEQKPEALVASIIDLWLKKAYEIDELLRVMREGVPEE